MQCSKISQNILLLLLLLLVWSGCRQTYMEYKYLIVYEVALLSCQYMSFKYSISELVKFPLFPCIFLKPKTSEGRKKRVNDLFNDVDFDSSHSCVISYKSNLSLNIYFLFWLSNPRSKELKIQWIINFITFLLDESNFLTST